MWNLKYFIISLLLLFIFLNGLDCKRQKQIIHKKEFVTLHEWTTLRMTFPTNAHLKAAIRSGHYDRSKPLPVDVDVEYGDDGYHRTFLTIPRLSNGVPYTLAAITDSDNTTLMNPKVVPYPNYEWHSSYGRNCSGITSAIRTYIDECWRLWIVDSGQINSMQYCAPQILAFDLVTDKLVHRFTFHKDLYTPGVSVFTALVVDVGEADPKNECRDAFVYVADPWGYGLIVYDALSRKSWRIEHKLMRPDKNLVKLNSANDGIFTVSISPKATLEGRQLYFHALNSFKEINVPLHIIKNASIWLDASQVQIGMDAFNVIGNRGTQCESESMDSAGNLYCSLISSNALINWKQGTEYNSDNLKVVAYNPEQLKFVTGLKINRNSAEEDEIWALSNDPKLFIGGRVKPGEIKFQIVGCRTKNLLNNERCSVGAVKE